MAIVKLSKQYQAGEAVFDTVELREPTYKDVYMDGLGQPAEWQPAGKGNAVRVVYPDIIDKYLIRLVQTPGYEHISRISATDAMRLEKAVCDFFREAAE